MKSFSARQLLGNTAGRTGKTSLRAVDIRVDVGVGVGVVRERDACKFCFAGTTCPEELFVSFLPLAVSSLLILSFSSISREEKHPGEFKKVVQFLAQV